MPQSSKSSDALRVAVDNFRSSINAYYQFLGVIHPVLDALPAKEEGRVAATIQQIMEAFAGTASREERKELLRVLRITVRDASENSSESPVTEDAPAQEATPSAPSPYDVSPKVGNAIVQLFKAIRSRMPAAQHRDILYRGVLTGIVGQFEVLLSDLAHHFFRRAPGALGSSDKVLSVSDLLSFASIEEATDHVIADRVDDLLRGSAEEWRRFFDSRLKVSLAATAPDWNRFVEYIQRRHLIVHAGSRLSRRYLSIVDVALQNEYFAKPYVGQPIRLALPYVTAALHSFEATGVVLGFSCWLKLHGDFAAEQSSLLEDYVYETMLAGRWLVVLHLASWGADQENFDASSRLTFRCNSWLALKRYKPG